jgi:hypothetical protein
MNEFDVRQISPNHSAIDRLRNAYLRHFGLSGEEKSSGVTWFGVFADNELALVFAGGLHPDGGFEGTDLYMSPTRVGIRAAYDILKKFREFVDAGVFPYAKVSTYTGNHAMARRLRAVYGVDAPEIDGERTQVWAYRKAKN